MYTIFLAIYRLGISVVSIWNVKAAAWVKGRSDIFDKIALELNNKTTTTRTIWMHCASLGEFEQGRPLLEEIRILEPSSRLIITFFSPSGFEIRKNYQGVDHIFYLPMDGARNATRFIELINPSLVLWIKYEFWYYYLAELKRQQIPTFLISGAFREGQPFFSSYGMLWRKMLFSFTHIFLQNQVSANLLATIGLNSDVTIAGDTRFDRVISTAENYIDVPGLDAFCRGRQVVVAGSTWEDDEALFVHYAKVNPTRIFIIAPHETDKQNLEDLKKEFPHSIFYSELLNLSADTGFVIPGNNVLIIDSVGLLSRMYKYADVTYVGGGFGDDGLHNILEAAVYGKPVVFGPEIEKNLEATDMIDAGGAICIENAVELEAALNEMLNNELELQLKGAAAKKYVYQNAGATKKIITYLQENHLLASPPFKGE